MSNLFLQTLDLWLARSAPDVCADGARELELALFGDGWDSSEGEDADTEQAPTPMPTPTAPTQRSRPGAGQTPDGCALGQTSKQEANEPLRA